MRRSLPGCGEVNLYWGLHFALAMAHHTIRESERLTKLSEGLCDLDDVAGIIERVVAVAVTALTGGEARTADKVGEPIKIGQVIGEVGSTGRSTGPHLHYETRIDGEAVDPQKFLRAGVRLSAG